MEFITTKAKLTIEKDVIRQKQLVFKETYWWAHFIMLAVFLIYSIYELRLAIDSNDNEGKMKFIWIPVLIMWMWPHLTRLYEWLFVKTWKSTIPLAKVKDIKVIPQENTLETKVELSLSSGRKKFYVFRNAENQVDKFVEAVNAGIATNIALA